MRFRVSSKITISVFLAWFDFWMGFFWSASSGTLYFCPLPMCVISISNPEWVERKKNPCDGCGCMLEDNLGCPEMSRCIEYYEWLLHELKWQECQQEL